MNLRTIMISTLLMCFTLPALSRGDEMSDLQQRFKGRYPVLLQLREAGTIGEMYNGLTGAVLNASLETNVTEPGRETPRTLKAFLTEENTDRIKLYQLIAAEAKTSPEVVAKHNALRRFEKAKPDEYLKPSKDGAWVQKKDLTNKSANDQGE